jgi:hypothetical protein
MPAIPVLQSNIPASPELLCMPLKDVIDLVVTTMESSLLSDQIAIQPSYTVKNPFA